MSRRKNNLGLSAKDLIAIAGELGTSVRVFDDNEVRQLLRAAVERAGTQVAFAERHRLDRAHLNQVLRGKGRPSRSLLKCLGLRTVFTVAETANSGAAPEAHAITPALEQSEA